MKAQNENQITSPAGRNETRPEAHPLQPFLPAGARLLMLGSFPPKRERWSMEFFYPNFQNDMWRIVGTVFFGDRDRFVVPGSRRFDRERIVAFCQERGIALYDTAAEVIRTRDNASDKFLEVVRPVDLAALLGQLPECRAVAVTGQKAADTFAEAVGCAQPPVGGCVEVTLAGRSVQFWRMPSSSRAYPKPLEEKAAVYRRLFEAAGLL